MLLPLLASLQQYLPFTVLKLSRISLIIDTPHNVATVLTVYGIETSGRTKILSSSVLALQQYLPFTVLKPSRVA